MKYPKGFHKRGQTQVAVRFPDKLFAEIIKMAKEEGMDFNSMVLNMVLCGKLDLEESDAHELFTIEELKHDS